MNPVSQVVSLSRCTTEISPCTTRVGDRRVSVRSDVLDLPRPIAPQQPGKDKIAHLDEAFVRTAVSEVVPSVARLAQVSVDASQLKVRLLNKEDMEHEQIAVMQRVTGLPNGAWHKIEKTFVGQVGGRGLLRDSPCLMDYATNTLLLSESKFTRVPYDTLRSHLFRALLHLGIAQTQKPFMERSDGRARRYADELLHHGAKSGAAETARRDMVRDMALVAGYLRCWRGRANKTLYPCCKKLSRPIFAQMRALSHGGALSNLDAIRKAEERAAGLSQANAYFKI